MEEELVTEHMHTTIINRKQKELKLLCGTVSLSMCVHAQAYRSIASREERELQDVEKAMEEELMQVERVIHLRMQPGQQAHKQLQYLVKVLPSPHALCESATAFQQMHDLHLDTCASCALGGSLASKVTGNCSAWSLPSSWLHSTAFKLSCCSGRGCFMSTAPGKRLKPGYHHHLMP